MTPPPAVGHAARPNALTLPTPSVGSVGGLPARLLAPRAWPRLRFLVDAVVLCLASCAALFASSTVRGGANHWLAATFPLLVVALLHARRSPDDRLKASLIDTGAHVLSVVSLSAMLTIALGSILGEPHPVALAVRLWLFSFVYLGIARAVLLSLRRQAVRNEALATPTLVVGAGVVGEYLVKRLGVDSGYGLRAVGFIDADPLPLVQGAASSLLPVLGGPADLASAIEQTGARQVLLAFSSEPDHVLVQRVKECQQLGVQVALVPRLYESINERSTLDHIGGLPLVRLHPTDPRGWQFAVKHSVDWGVAGLALIALAPLMIAIAIAIRITSSGPVLFRQQRVGRDGTSFDLLKFRTMDAQTDLEPFVLPEGCAPGGVEGTDRRTRVGRRLRELSLDELPQLINVLRGDMSLVGPRPERPEFVERFRGEVDRYQDRHWVKSGITGWAQVNGLRGQTSIADRVECDNYYIRNWSLWLDLRIVALTFLEIWRVRG